MNNTTAAVKPAAVFLYKDKKISRLNSQAGNYTATKKSITLRE